jgi:hypothetical protein
LIVDATENQLEMLKILFFTIISFGLAIVPVIAQEALRHDFVRKGTQSNDIKMGDYVVVAQTVSEADAKKFVKEMKKLNLPVPVYGYQSNKKFWFVYFDGSDDIERARQKRNELAKHDMYKSAWLLTIHQ